MKLDSNLVQQLQNAFDLDEAVDLLRRAIQTPSITGSEAAFADLLYAELKRTRVDELVKRDFLPGRPNVWGLSEFKIDLEGEQRSARD